MSTLLPIMLQFWKPLLASLAPLVLSIICLLAMSVLLLDRRGAKSARRTTADYLLAAGNLLATVSWCLIYADSIARWSSPLVHQAAPLVSLACLLLLPTFAGIIATRLRPLRLEQTEALTYGLSLAFQALTLYPGLYALSLFLELT